MCVWRAFEWQSCYGVCSGVWEWEWSRVESSAVERHTRVSPMSCVCGVRKVSVLSLILVIHEWRPTCSCISGQ